VLTVCRRHGVPLLVNDDVGLARDLGADGVHLGRHDMTLTAARVLLGPEAIIGMSCYDQPERAYAAQAEGADYVAFGSFFPSATKPGAVRADLGMLRAARRHLHLPVVAIGGLTPENAPALLAAGADLLAVVQGIFGAADPRAAAARYRAVFEALRTPRTGPAC
jgi:thiamine-phosphate pyrophosphorylase